MRAEGDSPASVAPANNLAFARKYAALVREGQCDELCRRQVDVACDRGILRVAKGIAVPFFTDPESPGYAPFNEFITVVDEAEKSGY